MTQLVQLQGVSSKLLAKGYSLFAISNDPVEILDEFAVAHGITFSLLSDEKSEVIKAFGIMNQLIEPDEGRSMRWYGIPYPGTYYLNDKCVVTDKDFHQHHARRASGQSVLARALGLEVEADPDTEVVAESGDISVKLGMSESALQLEVISQMMIDFEVPEGWHVYAPGAPEAFTPLSLSVDGEGLRFGEVNWPDSEIMSDRDLDLAVPVFSGSFRISIPVAATSEIIRLGHEISESVNISVAVSFQMCNELECKLPETVKMNLRAKLARLVEPEGLSILANRVEVIEAESGVQVR